MRSVAAGVVGVAAVQAVLAGAGLFLANVPAAGLWTALVLVLAVAQLPTALIMVPAIFYVVTTSDSTLTQVLFTIWTLIVAPSDHFLKPLFLGRGMKVPVPIILVGAIGGLVRHGIIGLFVGTVVLAIESAPPAQREVGTGLIQELRNMEALERVLLSWSLILPAL